MVGLQLPEFPFFKMGGRAAWRILGVEVHLFSKLPRLRDPQTCNNLKANSNREGWTLEKKGGRKEDFLRSPHEGAQPRETSFASFRLSGSLSGRAPLCSLWWSRAVSCPPRRFREEAPRPAMAIKWRVVKAVGTAVGIFGGAVLVFQVWPSEEVRSAKISKEFRESSQNYSDSQRQNALIMEILKEAATTDENWARKSFSSKK